MSDYLSEMDISYRGVVAQEMPGPVQSLHNAERPIFPNTRKHFIGADGVKNAQKLIQWPPPSPAAKKLCAFALRFPSMCAPPAY